MSKITRALISVSDKTGIIEFAKFLQSRNIEILSTGGTAKALNLAGIPVKEVSEHTDFPEMLDGRVKTLHPKIHGGLLGRRGVDEHEAAMLAHNIEPIDLVIINLYPFEETVAKGADYDTCVENIDIGGPAMIRSAAKNHESVTVIIDPADYAAVSREIEESGAVTLETRKKLAAKAFSRTAAYDSAISIWFAKTLHAFPEYMNAGKLKQVLRYGENPHQEAAFYTYDHAPLGVSTARQIGGKELSYNNINDTDAAFGLVSEFSEPAIAIIKHANPCGVAVGASIEEAYKKALACDPVSAYGGIIAANRVLDVATVQAIGNLFAEVIIAPDAEPEAIKMLESKKNLRLLLTGGMPEKPGNFMVKQVSGGFLFQEFDNAKVTEQSVKLASARKPTEAELRDMIFAFTVAKHVKSNAIVIAKDMATVGIGAGQMSRVDSVRIACWKAEEAKLSTKGAVLASDAFFPFDDNVHNAAKAGIVAMIHPGGSIRDNEVIKAADGYGMAMVLTGVRHFRH
ncbi:MAG TPA: bifunctional phosphoribosylaminoimidazolecarboxamide formyltransferase/IMP cyclohydrolase [Rickettsiales bacterium]|nr:bifunctional phosphoribosylaminoimidazolecarboxamide formyltransferase/IMP cyclohydrolase [Rickettsiales bacterium]